jgi:flagellar basal-body rod modification protein FlgD
MAFSANVDSINPTSTKTPQVVSAGIGDDGTVDLGTSKVTGGDAASAAAKIKKSELGKNDFLMLLITQLKYQDPMSPMDNTQFLSQMAQFQSLEANNNVLKAIEDLGTSYKDSVSAQQSSAASMNNASSVSLIGKQVRIKETNVLWDGAIGSTIPITVNLGSNSGATVQVLDSDGKVLKTIQTKDKDSQNSSTVSWDGTSDNGDYVQAGTYKINIVGQDTDDSLYAFIQDIVQGVRFGSDGVLLKIAGKELAASDVMDVAMSDDASGGFSGISASSAVELLGKTVKVRQQTITYNQIDGEHDVFKVNTNPGSLVRVGITDKNGNMIAAFQQRADSSGVATIDWNGLKMDNSFADKGTYNIMIDGEENNPSLYAFTVGTVDGVSNLSGMVTLRVGGKNVLLSNIMDITPTPSTSSIGTNV